MRLELTAVEMVGDPGRGRVDLRAGPGAPVGKRVEGSEWRVDLRLIEEIKGIEGDEELSVVDCGNDECRNPNVE